MTWNCSVILT